MILKREQQGFTLIESAIVILVLSFVLIPLFQFMTEQEEFKQSYIENRKKERVIGALNKYFKDNLRYPCPAANVSVQAAAFGQEGVCAGAVTEGDLPVEELNLSWEYAVNRFGWKYNYVVTTALTTGPNANGAIAIEDGVNTFASNVHYVVIDPGKDAKGATSIYGVNSGTACGAAAKDSENCNGDATFIDSVVNDKMDINDGDYFDDRLFYSLANENDSMFLTRQSANFENSKLDIVNRNDGFVGFGFTNLDGEITSRPTEKLHILGNAPSATDVNIGLRVNGVLRGQGSSVEAGEKVRSQNVIRSLDETRATRFCYGTSAC